MTNNTSVTVHLPGRDVRIEIKNNMYYLGESMFMFTGYDDLIETVKEYDSGRIPGNDSEKGQAKAGSQAKEAQSTRD
jgi:hypothetical protein